MTTQLVIDKDPGSVATYVTPFSDEVAALVMAADVDATIPVPTDANIAIIYYDTGKDIFVRADAVVTLPTNSTPTANAGVLLKPSVDVKDVDVLHFRSDVDAFVCVEFYR